jgi:type II secretory pathway component PulF
MTTVPTNMDTPAQTGRLHALYPNIYCWFLLFSSLDIMLTHTILGRFGAFGGRELNSIADYVIKVAGLWGAIGLKFVTCAIAIGILEYIGRRRPALGQRLARLMLILSIFPVAWELIILAWFAFTPHQ